VVLLYSGAGVLRAGALGQNNGLHFAGSVALDLVAAEEVHRQATIKPNCSIPDFGIEHGIVGSLVGTISSGHARGTLRINTSGAYSGRQPRGLLLSQQTILAIEPDIHLPQVDNQRGTRAGLCLVSRRDRRMRADFLYPKVLRTCR